MPGLRLQILGQYHGLSRNFCERSQRVSPFWMVYSSVVPGCAAAPWSPCCTRKEPSGVAGVAGWVAVLPCGEPVAGCCEVPAGCCARTAPAAMRIKAEVAAIVLAIKASRTAILRATGGVAARSSPRRPADVRREAAQASG